MKKIINENGIAISILIAWLFINFICLKLAQLSFYSKERFFPFTESSLKHSYDFTEFLVYGVTPIVIFVIIKIISNEKK